MECLERFTGTNKTFPVYMRTKRAFQEGPIDFNKNGVEAEISGYPVVLDDLWKKATVLEAIDLRRGRT